MAQGSLAPLEARNEILRQILRLIAQSLGMDIPCAAILSSTTVR